MKVQVHLRLLVGVAVFLFAVPGCNDLPTTGTSIAGTPDGVAEIMVVKANGETELKEIGFL
ncbi:MAG: hypothetical protein H7Z17_19810, partial [Fuerstia sp.]|nr:hypothetical protein [Fuerstiella sp.]